MTDGTIAKIGSPDKLKGLDALQRKVCVRWGMPPFQAQAAQAQACRAMLGWRAWDVSGAEPAVTTECRM